MPDREEGGFTVIVPALPGCITEGDTLDEALANAQEAIALHVAAMEADGEPVPEETDLPQLATVEVA
jgi:predicted RNase H-like HicB family nuclease